MSIRIAYRSVYIYPGEFVYNLFIIVVSKAPCFQKHFLFAKERRRKNANHL